MAALLVFSVLLAVLGLAYVFKRLNDPARQVLCAPENEAHWLWGHELSIWKHQASVKYLEWTVALGSVYRIKASFFQRDIIVAGDHGASHHVLSNAYRYPKAPAFLPITDKLIGKGVVYAQGEEHKHQRRMITPAFTLSAVRDMADDVVECSQKFASVVSKHVVSQGGESSMNMGPFVSACTLDIIGRIAFSHDFGCGTSEEAKNIISSWHKDVLLSRTIAGFLAPILMCTFPWITKLPIPALQTDGVAKSVALQLGRELLENNRAQLESGDGKDILSILVKAQTKVESSDKLSNTTLLENISTFIMVGHETTSCTVSFTLYELARHPSVQSLLRQEVAHVTDFGYDSINTLPYLDAVCREGLRVHPAAASTDRIALTDDVIPLSNPLTLRDGSTVTSIPIKAGQVIHIPMGAQNLNPAIWGTDAAEFKPERWLTEKGVLPTEQLPYGPYAGVSSFLDGQRACIGWRLAVFEFKVMLASIIRDLEFTCTEDNVEGFIAGTLQPIVGKEVKMPLNVRVLTSAPQ